MVIFVRSFSELTFTTAGRRYLSVSRLGVSMKCKRDFSSVCLSQLSNFVDWMPMNGIELRLVLVIGGWRKMYWFSLRK